MKQQPNSSKPAPDTQHAKQASEQTGEIRQEPSLSQADGPTQSAYQAAQDSSVQEPGGTLSQDVPQDPKEPDACLNDFTKTSASSQAADSPAHHLLEDPMPKQESSHSDFSATHPSSTIKPPLESTDVEPTAPQKSKA